MTVLSVHVCIVACGIYIMDQNDSLECTCMYSCLWNHLRDSMRTIPYAIVILVYDNYVSYQLEGTL